MQSAWNDHDANAAVAHYAGLGRDLALRVYTTRLLGQDPRLVLHGGGNTSVKTKLADLNGDEVDVLCVKGSGWDMGTIEPADRPAGGRAVVKRGRVGHGHGRARRPAGGAARAAVEAARARGAGGRRHGAA